MTSTGLPAPTFDLESWITNYSGPLVPLRLRHIAVLCPALSQQAINLALQSAKAGKDIEVYRSLIELATNLGVAGVEIDQDWVARQDDSNKRELSRLEGELRGYKNNLIRESIRMGQEDLANHLLLTGGPAKPKEQEAELQASQYGIAAAYAAYGKMRDFCTTPTHIAGMTLRLMFTAFIQAVAATASGASPLPHFGAINTQASRLSSTGVKAEEETKMRPIWLSARGIAFLGQSSYREAALAFSQVEFALTTNGAVQGYDFCRTTASASDIAIYGGLTALATMTRQELEDLVLAGELRAFLELEPHMRKAITLFTTGKYKAALDMLWRYYSDWNLDVFLGAGFGTKHGSHVDRLLARVRERSIISHFSSFSQISLASLAETFPARQGSLSISLEDELIGMIKNGSLNARLDIVNGVLFAPHQDRRGATHAAAVQTANEIERTLLQRLYKINIAIAKLELPQVKGQGGSGGWSTSMRS